MNESKEEKPHWTTGREKLDMVAGYAGWLAEENLRLENASLEKENPPPRPFDPDAAFETIRLRKGRRPAEDATTAGDAGSGRSRTQRRNRQGTPTLRTLGRRYEIIFRACEVVHRKEKLFNYRDPTTPARVAALYAARQALFERLGGRGPRRRA